MAAITVGIKFYEDHYYDNAFYAKVGGIQCRDLNRLEVEMLERLDYDLNVPSEIYQRYLEDLLCPGSKSASPQVASSAAGPAESKPSGIPQVPSNASMNTIPSSNDLAHEEAP